MPRNQLVTDVAAVARELGWRPKVGFDQVQYVEHAASGMRSIAIHLRASKAPSWLSFAYEEAASDLHKGKRPIRALPLDGVWVEGSDLLLLAYAAPARWVAEASVMATGRRAGRILKLIRACSRIQMAMTRHGVIPVGRATPISDDGRTRDVYLLVRETEIERESERFGSLWTGGESSAQARPSSAIGDARDHVEGWDD